MAAEGKAEIIGICGGFQFRAGIFTPTVSNLRGKPNEDFAFAVYTVLMQEKILKVVEGKHIGSGLDVKGYENTSWRAGSGSLSPLVVGKDGRVIGFGRGLIWGTYLHGIFDADEFRRWFIDGLRRRRGLSPVGRVVVPFDLEPAFERLADVVRENLAMDAIYNLMGLK